MWRKLLFFCLMYFVQGAALAYVINFQKPMLLSRGVSLEQIGLMTSLLLIPFMGKMLLGAVSDRWPIGRLGARKPYMFLGLGIFAISYGLLSDIDPGESFMLFAVLSWIASLGLAWFDTCADGWAVDVAREEEQGAIQAAMIGGKSLGLILLSAGFGHLVSDYGYPIVFISLAALAAVVLLLVALADFKTVRNHDAVSGWRDLLQLSYLAFAAFGVVYSVASFGTDGLLTLHLSELFQADPLEVGYFGMIRGGGALVGAIGYAFLSPRIGRTSAQYLALILLGAGCLLPLSPLNWPTEAAVWGFCWGFQETAYVTLAMSFSKGRWAATLFAAAMIYSNLGTSIGEALGAPLVPRLGYSGVFSLFAALAWISLFLAAMVFRYREQRQA